MNVGFLLDTNVLSEIHKRYPSRAVVDFVLAQPSSSLFVSSLTLGELRKGVEKKSRTDIPGAEQLAAWVDLMQADYGGRILPVSTDVATLWGQWSARRSRSIVDTLLAATAAVHRLVLVTRNVADVQDLPIEILNPWLEQ